MMQIQHQLPQVLLSEPPRWALILTAEWVEVFTEEEGCMAQACTDLHMAAWEVECMEEVCTAVVMA